MVAVDGGGVIEEQHEKDDNGAYQGCREGVQKLFEAGLAENIAVSAEDGVEGEPSGRHEEQAEPVVGVGKDGLYARQGERLRVRRVEGEFAESKERRPREQCCQQVEKDIFEGLLFLHLLWIGVGGCWPSGRRVS